MRRRKCCTWTFVFGSVDDLADDLGPRDQRLADLDAGVGAGQQHLVELDVGAGLSGAEVDANDFAFFHLILA